MIRSQFGRTPAYGAMVPYGAPEQTWSEWAYSFTPQAIVAKKADAVGEKISTAFDTALKVGVLGTVGLVSVYVIYRSL